MADIASNPLIAGLLKQLEGFQQVETAKMQALAKELEEANRRYVKELDETKTHLTKEMEENKSRLTKELEETQERLQAMRDKANKYRQLKRDNALLSLQIERLHRDNKNYQQRLQEAGLQEKDRPFFKSEGIGIDSDIHVATDQN